MRFKMNPELWLYLLVFLSMCYKEKAQRHIVKNAYGVKEQTSLQNLWATCNPIGVYGELCEICIQYHCIRLKNKKLMYLLQKSIIS